MRKKTLMERNGKWGWGGSLRLLSITAIALILGFAFTACEGEPNGQGTNGTSTESQHGDGTKSGAGTFADPFELEVDVWAHGEITANTADSTVYFYFNATSDTTYYIWWNDSYEGDDTKTLDAWVYCEFYNSIGYVGNFYEDDGWSIPLTYTPSSNGIIYIDVSNFYDDEYGTFAITYSTTNTRPGSTPGQGPGPGPGPDPEPEPNPNPGPGPDKSNTAKWIGGPFVLDDGDDGDIEVTIESDTIIIGGTPYICVFGTPGDVKNTGGEVIGNWITVCKAPLADPPEVIAVLWDDYTNPELPPEINVGTGSNGIPKIITRGTNKGYTFDPEPPTDYDPATLDSSGTVEVGIRDGEPGSTEDNPIKMTLGKWVHGYYTRDTMQTYYTFDVPASGTFYFWVNDKEGGDGTKTGAISFYCPNGVGGFLSGLGTHSNSFVWGDNYYVTPHSASISSTDFYQPGSPPRTKVTMVINHYSSSLGLTQTYGTYAIAVSYNTNARPTN